MRKSIRLGVCVLMLASMASNVWAAAAGCVRPEEMRAVRTAAVQQRLMVAALSCDASQLYNKFVTTFRPDLQASDRALQNFFRRLNGRTGDTEYNAFKTRLANASSMQSIGNITEYCDSANQMFTAAFAEVKVTLANFISGQTTAVDNNYEPCPAVRTVAAPAPAPKAVPKPPVRARAFILRPEFLL